MSVAGRNIFITSDFIAYMRTIMFFVVGESVVFFIHTFLYS